MTSYIEFKGKGFWINDSLMQVIAAFLYCELKDDQYFKNKEAVLENLKNNSLGYYASYMHLNIDKFLDDSELRKFSKKLLSIVFTLNNSEKDEVCLKDLCNYQDYRSIEYYLPDTMKTEVLISYLLKILYLVEEYLFPPTS
jgi:hypothetical protein